MSKVVSIDGNRYVLPEGMTGKDVQALAGFLVTLTKVESNYLWGGNGYSHYLTEGAQVRLEEVEILSRADAQARADKSREDYEAKEAAKKAAVA
jgi:hypothetical protein